MARHLGIRLSEYDRRIRSFIPYYEEMLDVVASLPGLTRRRAPVMVDLGIGTGALAARCLSLHRGRLQGLDADPAMLLTARRRLRRYAQRLTLVQGNFVSQPLPRCDAVVATLALHHIRTSGAKRRFYRRCYGALRPGGVLASGDAFLAADTRLNARFMATWLAHMERSYTARQARRFLAAWAREDRYFSLDQEISMLAGAGFATEVVWRRPPFAVLLGRKRPGA
ncbi:MAG TPA: class I SAM-dependent methyltransferase [Gemmatimonadales bacterium]|nr:class I SAM-dependent methyltransferase [Gemmatimonadales bacterium]